MESYIYDANVFIKVQKPFFSTVEKGILSFANIKVILFVILAAPRSKK